MKHHSFFHDVKNATRFDEILPPQGRPQARGPHQRRQSRMCCAKRRGLQTMQIHASASAVVERRLTAFAPDIGLIGPADENSTPAVLLTRMNNRQRPPVIRLEVGLTR
jgi:hypothetical protein